MKFPYESQTRGTFHLVRGMNKPEKSEVYLVSSADSGEYYVLRKMYGDPSVYQQLFYVKNPHIPAVFEICQSTDCYYVLEEYISGANLADVIVDGTMSGKKARSMMEGLCDGLTVLHNYGIVHRDVKPENIIIREEIPVLIDYDAARIHKSANSGDTEVLGTTGFAAPEQYGIYQTDERTDIYAMGVLLNIMLTGQHPTVTLAPGGAGRIVRKCTMVNPGQRFQTAEQLKARLHTISWPDTRKIVLGAGAAVVIFAVGAVLLWPKTQEAAVISEPPETQQEALEQQATQPDIEIQSVVEEEKSPTQQTADALGVRVDELLGYYVEMPQMGDAPIRNFTFILTEEQHTLYFVYPDEWQAHSCNKIQCFTEDGSYVEPTSDIVLEHISFGESMPTELPGYSCVPITIDLALEGMGNLHMDACYDISNAIGGNIYIYSLDEAKRYLRTWEDQLAYQARGNRQLMDGQEEMAETENSKPGGDVQKEGRMAYYGECPAAESEALMGEFILSEENRTVWLLFSEMWFGEVYQSMEIYLGDGSDGPPQPTSQNVLEHITLGEPEPSEIEGCLCVPITVDEGYRGEGNLHINLTYGTDLVVGGNVFLLQE